MVARKAHAEWQGDIKGGKGKVALGSGAFESQYSFSSRFENGTGTNPEELIGAAHAGCFSMQLSGLLTQAGHPPTSIKTDAAVYVEPDGGGFTITKIDLTTTGEVPGLDEAGFKELAEKAKEICPVSRALAGTKISLETKFVG